MLLAGARTHALRTGRAASSVVFAPFYFADAAGIDGVAAVFTRLAPFKRGLFEVRVYFDYRTGN